MPQGGERSGDDGDRRRGSGGRGGRPFRGRFFRRPRGALRGRNNDEEHYDKDGEGNDNGDVDQQYVPQPLASRARSLVARLLVAPSQMLIIAVLLRSLSMQ